MDWRATSGGALALRCARTLAEQGFHALLAGGCVRDTLLGREPKDFDIATSATPEQIARTFAGAVAVGAHFGVMLVRDGGAQVEIATFRSDHAYHDGRRPSGVTFETDPREDAARRDFTINGMFLDPVTGAVLDTVGGRADLEARVVRAIGDPVRRFEEDHLRMLRAVRFAARLGFSIDPATRDAIALSAPAIHRISAERVRDEIVRILTEGGASHGLRLMDETPLLAEVLPEVKALQGVEQPPQFHPEGDVWTHTLLMLDESRPTGVTLALGILLHDIGKPATFQRAADRIRFHGHVEKGMEIARAMLGRLRFSNEVTSRVLALIEHHMTWRHLRDMRESTLKKFLRLDHFDEHLELHRADCLSSHRQLDNYEFARARLAAMPPEVIRPPRLLTGYDLAEEGYRPGPRFTEIMDALEDAQLEGKLRDREEALSFVRQRWPLP